MKWLFLIDKTQIMMNKDYPYIHWFLAILLGPFFWLLYEIIDNNLGIKGLFEVLFPMLLIGFFYSIPVFLIYIVSFHLLIKKSTSIFLIKSILITIGVLGVFITLELISGSIIFKLELSYSLSLLLAGLVTKLKIKQAL